MLSVNANREQLIQDGFCIVPEALSPEMVEALRQETDIILGCNHLFLGVIGLLALYPFIYTLSMSLSSQAEAIRLGLHLFPREISLTAYKLVLADSSIVTGYLNAIIRTACRHGFNRVLYLPDRLSAGTARNASPTIVSFHYSIHDDLQRRDLFPAIFS